MKSRLSFTLCMAVSRLYLAVASSPAAWQLPDAFTVTVTQTRTPPNIFDVDPPLHGYASFLFGIYVEGDPVVSGDLVVSGAGAAFIPASKSNMNEMVAQLNISGYGPVSLQKETLVEGAGCYKVAETSSWFGFSGFRMKLGGALQAMLGGDGNIFNWNLPPMNHNLTSTLEMSSQDILTDTKTFNEMDHADVIPSFTSPEHCTSICDAVNNLGALELFEQLPSRLQAPGCSSLRFTYDDSTAPRPAGAHLHTCWNATIQAHIGLELGDFIGDMNVLYDVVFSEWEEAADFSQVLSACTTCPTADNCVTVDEAACFDDDAGFGRLMARWGQDTNKSCAAFKVDEHLLSNQLISNVAEKFPAWGNPTGSCDVPAFEPGSLGENGKSVADWCQRTCSQCEVVLNEVVFPPAQAKITCLDVKGYYQQNSCCGMPGKVISYGAGQHTCGDVKSYYKEYECCGAPANEIPAPSWY